MSKKDEKKLSALIEGYRQRKIEGENKLNQEIEEARKRRINSPKLSKVQEELRKRATLLYGNGEFEEAAKYYKKAGLKDEIKKMYEVEGNRCIDRNLDKALEYYKKAGLKNKVKLVLERKAETYLRQGDLDLNLDDLNKAAEYYGMAGSRNKIKSMWELQGNCWMSRDPEKAAECYRRAGLKDKAQKALSKKEGNSLDNIVNLVVMGGAFLCSFIFLSGSITGNTILNSSIKTSNFIGAGLFIVGVVVSFIYTKRR